MGLKLWFAISLLYLVGISYAEENYYDVLGVSKDATTKEIRKGFKKIALKLHPDKNTGDPDAHDKFVRVNNMYEVLKDSETREKYDKYGEEGLKEGFGGNRYESWQYYRDEFGIYDDDPEVVTLDSGDFDAAVNSGEVWFVNFYSPRCSHCHELAPTWREFAEEMGGIVNIGAVNCYDSRGICQNNQIYSYPSLVMFIRGKRPIQYQGDRSKKDLNRFVMKYVTVEVIDLWDKNWEREISTHPSHLPWIVALCNPRDEDDDDDVDDDGNCPGDMSVKKLAGLLNGIVNVAMVNCDDSPKLCKLAAVSTSPSGFYYFPVDTFPTVDDDVTPVDGSSTNHHRFESLDPREIRVYYMKNFMPSIKSFSVGKLRGYVMKKPLLAFLKFNEDTDDVDVQETQLKKLPEILKKDNIVVCKVMCNDWCKEHLQLTQDATILFRGSGHRDFEVFHGRMKTSELSAFAVESATARVTTLNPSDFNGGQIVDQETPHFVDFFAPWCPPCKAFLPELRKTSNNFPDIKFGSVDCVMHKDLCNSFGIRSYPSSLLLNGTKISQYHGHLDMNSVSQFIRETINPPFEVLDAANFDSMVINREPGVTWAVAFFATNCPPCQQLHPEWVKVARMLDGGDVKIGSIDCMDNPENQNLCIKKQLVTGYPEIRIYPSKKKARSKPLYIPYEGYQRQSRTIVSWIIENMPSNVKTMDASDYQKSGVLKSKDAWVIDFYANWCGPCHQFMPKFYLTAMKFKSNPRVKFGKIDCQNHPTICSTARIRAYPTLVFFPPGDERVKQSQRRFIETQEPDEIAQNIENFMRSYPEPKLKDEL